MSKVKKAVFEEEEALDKTLQSIEELKNLVKEPTEEEIENLFSHAPLQVEEVLVADTTIEITPLRDSSFSFGGVRYHLTKNKKQRVPIAVRDFLLRNKTSPRIKDVW